MLNVNACIIRKDSLTVFTHMRKQNVNHLKKIDSNLKWKFLKNFLFFWVILIFQVTLN